MGRVCARENISVTAKNDADGAPNLFLEKLEEIRRGFYKSEEDGWKLALEQLFEVNDGFLWIRSITLAK